MSSTPKSGDNVRAFVRVGQGVDGTDIAPATVTRVHGKHPEGGHVVDLHVNPWGSEVESRTSVRLLADEDEARRVGGYAAFPAKD